MPPRDRQALDLFGAPPQAPSVESRLKPRPAPQNAKPRPSQESERVKPQHVHIEPVKANVEPPDDPRLPYWVQAWWINADQAYRTKPKEEVLGYETTAIAEHKRRRKPEPEKTHESIARLSGLKSRLLPTPEYQAFEAATKALREVNKLVGVGPVLRGDHGSHQVTVSDRPDLVKSWRAASKALDTLIQSLGGRPSDIHSITI